MNNCHSMMTTFHEMKRRHPDLYQSAHWELAAACENRAARRLVQRDRNSTVPPTPFDIGQAIDQHDGGRFAAYWQKAETGDLDSARILARCAPAVLLPVLVECAIARNMPKRELQVLVEVTWKRARDWWVYRFGLGGDPLITDVFYQAGFDNSHLPEEVELFSGGQSILQTHKDPSSVFGGMRYTLKREVAYAWAGLGLWIPFMARLRVPRNSILAHFKDRGEDEIVVEPDDLAHCEIKFEEPDTIDAPQYH